MHFVQQQVLVNKNIIKIRLEIENTFFDQIQFYHSTMQTTVEDLAQKISELQLRLKELDVVNTQKNSLFVLGITGSGKSSIISYLLGANVTCVKKGIHFSLTHNQVDRYPAIGNTNQSCTMIPSLYSTENNTFYDPPGFLDTKGIEQEILNSYSNAKMFRRGSRAKIILVVEFATLQSARGGDLPLVAKRLSQLFREDFMQIIHSCVLIITKVDSQKYSKEDILAEIQNIVGANKNINSQSEMLLNTIVMHKRVEIFPLPYLINQSTILTIKKSIDSLVSFIISRDTHVSLSSDAKLEIQKLSHILDGKINSAAEVLSSHIRKIFLQQNQSKQQITNNLGKIKAFKDLLDTRQLSSGKPKALEQLAVLVELDHQENQYLKNLFNQTEFCTTLHQHIKIVNNIEEILKIAVTDSEGKLTTMLTKISSKEQMNQLKLRFEEEKQSREQEFQAERQRYEDSEKERNSKITEQLMAQFENFQKMMVQSNQKFQENIQVMQQESKKDAQRMQAEFRQQLSESNQQTQRLIIENNRINQEQMNENNRQHNETIKQQQEAMNKMHAEVVRLANRPMPHLYIISEQSFTKTLKYFHLFSSRSLSDQM